MNEKTRRGLNLLLIAIIATSTLGAVFVYMQAQTTNSQIQPRVIKVACVGDSITANFGYPETLRELLGKNYLVGNYGLGGTTVNLDGETPYMREPIYGEAKESQPDIVIIMLGTNDAHPDLHKYNGSFVNDYITLVNAFQNLNSKPQIWIVKSPPIVNNETGLSPEFFRQNILPKIEEVAQRTGLPLIDAYTPLLGKPEYFIDGVHPTYEGAMLIADEVYKAISQK
jgi:lysophospholipase L1-like esterase